MKRFVRIVMGLVLGAVALFISINLGAGHGTLKSLQKIENKIKTSDSPKVELTAAGATVHQELSVNEIIYLKNFEICKPNNDFTYGFSESSLCQNGVCDVKIEFPDGNIPDDLNIYRKYQGLCQRQSISDVKKYIVKEYSAKINMDAKLTQQLKIIDPEHPKFEKTANSKFTGDGIISIGGRTTLILDYDKSPPTSDEFLLNSRLIKIEYQK